MADQDAFASRLVLDFAVTRAALLGAVALPAVLAALDETGPLGVRLHGELRRDGEPEPAWLPAEGGGEPGVAVRVPVRADLEVGGHPVQGAADVTVRVRPRLSGEALSFAVSAEHAWREALSVNVLGRDLSVSALADWPLRLALERLCGQIEGRLAGAADLPGTLAALRASLQAPLSGPLGSALLLRPQGLTLGALRLEGGELRGRAGAVLHAAAFLGEPPPLPGPLLTLTRGEPEGGGALRLPLRLPYPELSAALTLHLASRPLPLPGPPRIGPFARPEVRVSELRLRAAGGRLRAAARLELRLAGRRFEPSLQGSAALEYGQGRLNVRAPELDLQGGGLPGPLARWLTAGLRDLLARAAFGRDLGPLLERAAAHAEAEAARRAPAGSELRLNLSEMRLTELTVADDALYGTLTARAAPTLRLTTLPGKV